MPKTPKPLDPVKAHLEAGFQLREDLEQRRKNLLTELAEIDQQLALLPPRPPAIDGELLGQLTDGDRETLRHLCILGETSKTRIDNVVNDNWASRDRVDVDKACKRLRRMKLAEFRQRKWAPTLLGRQAAEALSQQED